MDVCLDNNICLWVVQYASKMQLKSFLAEKGGVDEVRFKTVVPFYFAENRQDFDYRSLIGKDLDLLKEL